MKRITIKDIARDLNLHHSTVSRALRDDKLVKEETRKLVFEYASVHGYQVNMSALQLRGSVKNTLAVLTPNLHHGFFSNIVSIITNLAYEKGYIVSVFQSNEKVEHEKEIVKTLIRNNVAGVIASVSMETNDSTHFKQLQTYHIPLVLFDRVCEDVNVPMVTVNNQEIVAETVNRFVKSGFNRIAHISGPKQVTVFRNRQAGYYDAVKKNSLEYSLVYEANAGFTVDEGIRIAGELFTKEIKPDALICDSHLLMLGIMMKIREMNLNNSQQIGMAAFGDNSYLYAINPNVISIVQPEEYIAQSAFELLMKKLENNDSAINQHLIYSARITSNEII